MHAAGAEPSHVHARAGGTLKEAVRVLTHLEQPQVRRHRADVHDVRTEVKHMVGDTAQLGEQDAQILRADRHFDAQQFLDGENVAVLHVERRAIIQSIEVRERLQVGLVLDQLLGTAMEQADMRIDALDDFAVQFHHQTQHAVRRRMLRAEIDRVIVDAGLGVVRGRVRSADGDGPRGHFFTSSALAGVGAPGASGALAFSSPGRIYSAPSHGLMKSKLRKSCASLTGS